MAYSQKFKEAIRAVIGKRSIRSVAEDAGISHTVLAEIARTGRIPREDTLVSIARLYWLEDEPVIRQNFLEAAGLWPEDTAPNREERIRLEHAKSQFSLAVIRATDELADAADYEVITSLIRAYVQARKRQRHEKGPG